MKRVQQTTRAGKKDDAVTIVVTGERARLLRRAAGIFGESPEWLAGVLIDEEMDRYRDNPAEWASSLFERLSFDSLKEAEGIIDKLRALERKHNGWQYAASYLMTKDESGRWTVDMEAIAEQVRAILRAPACPRDEGTHAAG